MPLAVQPLTLQDIPRLVEISFLSLSQSGFFRSVGKIPNPDSIAFVDPLSPSERKDVQIAHLTETWGKDPTLKILKAVDVETGEMVAFAMWHIFKGSEGLGVWQKMVGSGELERSVPKGILGNEREVQGWAFCWGKLNVARRELFGPSGKEHCLLKLLCTDPTHERRGAGSLLVQWGCDIANAAKIECYLEASKKGYPVYLREGFEGVVLRGGKESVIQFDVSQFTGRGGTEGDIVTLRPMVRRAR